MFFYSFVHFFIYFDYFLMCNDADLRPDMPEGQKLLPAVEVTSKQMVKR